jgi:predicted MFS family arabinose efflux permease
VADVTLIEPAPQAVSAPLTRRARLRALVHTYPRAVWLMALCNLTLWTGRGMVMPFLVIFFSQIAGLSASIVGTGIAISGLGGIVFVMVAAGQIDRRGGRPVLLACLAAIGIATVLHPWATSVVPFLAVTILLNFAIQLYWPSSDATIASVSDPDRVAEAMSILRVANAIGIGMGGLLGGIIVAGGGLAEYRVLFITSAALVGAAALLVWRAVPHVVLRSTTDAGEHGSWTDVLPDRTLLYCLLVLFALIFGFSQMTMTVPPFLRREAGIGEGTIGALFTLNTALVVLTQIPIAARVNRGNVGRLLALGAALWAIAFGCMLATPAYGVSAAIATFLAFTAGELLFMPITAVIPVRLAPIHLRGRYFAIVSIVWGGSWAIAALAGGLALDLPEPAILWPVLVALMLAGAAGALRLQASERLRPGRSGPAD